MSTWEQLTIYIGESDQWHGKPLYMALVERAVVRNLIAISLGAIAGALSRYYLTVWSAQRFGTSFPYGTFTINLSGALGIGGHALHKCGIASDIIQAVKNPLISIDCENSPNWVGANASRS